MKKDDASSDRGLQLLHFCIPSELLVVGWHSLCTGVYSSTLPYSWAWKLLSILTAQSGVNYLQWGIQDTSGKISRVLERKVYIFILKNFFPSLIFLLTCAENYLYVYEKFLILEKELEAQEELCNMFVIFGLRIFLISSKISVCIANVA